MGENRVSQLALPLFSASISGSEESRHDAQNLYRNSIAHVIWSIPTDVHGLLIAVSYNIPQPFPPSPSSRNMTCPVPPSLAAPPALRSWPVTLCLLYTPYERDNHPAHSISPFTLPTLGPMTLVITKPGILTLGSTPTFLRPTPEERRSGTPSITVVAEAIT